MEKDLLEVYGARVHNLKNIDVQIPRNKLVVITGLSGSGKSSLAFDTIYAEGQRRYIDSFSAYARQFLGKIERPDVDKITGLSPVISIEQKTVNRSPRSTVGTITEIYDFMRLLFARAGEAFSHVSGEKMVKYSDKQIIELIQEQFSNKKVLFLSPLVQGRKGHYRELFMNIRKQGFLKVRVDGEVRDIYERMQLDRYKVHDIEVVIDKLIIGETEEKRIQDALNLSMKQGRGVMMVQDIDTDAVRYYSRSLMCPSSGISYNDPAPNLFSFNSPYGACEKCNGLGEINEIDSDKIIPNKNLSIKKGGLAPLGEYKNNWVFKQIEAIGKKFDFGLNQPLKDIPEEALEVILFGADEILKVQSDLYGVSKTYEIEFEGIANLIAKQLEENPTANIQKWAHTFMDKVACPKCNGTRLKTEALYFKIAGKNISELAEMDISQLHKWFLKVEEKLNKNQKIIAKEVLKEIITRLDFLLDVGLDYLTLNRTSRSLSGGEAQRIRLATQIGSKLVGVLYILDEPSIGLHQRDNEKLIEALQKLRDLGNSVIVVEHDKDMILAADYVIDIGPKAGVHGGEISGADVPEKLHTFSSLTADYISGKMQIKIPEKRRKGNGKKLVLSGASGNNLKKVDLELPLGKFICVTGVSGSGKSTLINETLVRILQQHFYRANKNPLPYKKLKGIEHLDKIIEIDQSPIGRTPRSNPATYTGVFSDIRQLFAELPESKIRAYKPGRFSFNVKGGRCETCQGGGLKVIEMNFLPDVYVECETCEGKRYNRETLEVRYKGKSISDVLKMTIEDATKFFEHMPSIYNKIKTLQEVGLGYITLGQSSTTISGGEAQRVKLATELSKKSTGNTFYVLDEPTTGLHFEDIRILLEVLNTLVDQGNTVLVIEHNLDIIKMADYIVDLGPEGGKGGGYILSEGTPEKVAETPDSHTARFLKAELSTLLSH